MKKFISLIFALLLLSSLNISAFAESKACTIIGEMESISYDGYIYYRIDNDDFYTEGNDWEYLEYEFQDKAFQKRLDYVEILIPCGVNYIIEADIRHGSFSEYIYYVRSDKKEWMDGFLNGKNASHVITYNSNAYVNRYLDFEKIEKWISEENKVSVTAQQLKYCYVHAVYTTDNSKTLRLQVGDVYENGKEFYFVRYSDYSKADLFGNGTYANLSVAYKLSDKDYIEELKETYSEDATENVDEEILEGNEMVDGILNGFTEFSLIVIISMFFVIIPLAAIVVSFILLFVKHVSPIYRGWLKAIIVIAAIVVVCIMPIIIILF